MIPQLTARPAFVEELETLGADFHEIVLMDSRDTVLARFMARDPTRDTAAAVLQLYDALVASLPSRPRAHVVECRAGRFDEAYAALLAHLRDRLRTA